MKNLESQTQEDRIKAGQEILAYIKEKEKGECCLNIVACGPAKAGKSTLLNFILGPEPENLENTSTPFSSGERHQTDGLQRMNSKMLLTGHASETYLPWFFKASSDSEPDTIEVNHVDQLGKESKKKTFTNFEEYKKYITNLYSREAIKRKMEENKDFLGQNQKPYQLINVSYGVPSKINRIWKELESGVNMLDLQGLNEHGTDTTLKEIQGPFILFCCFGTSTGFFETEGFKIFKEIIENNSKIYQVCFVATGVETSMKHFKMNEDLDELAALKKVKDEVKKGLSESGLTVKFDLFFFDPTSQNSELRYEIKGIRQLLVDIKNHPAYFNRYKKKLKLMEESLAKNLEIEKKVLEAKVTRSEIFQDLQMFQMKWELYVDSLKTGLAKTFAEVLSKEFKNKVKVLAKRKETIFMENNANQVVLLKSLNDWFLHGGYKEAVSEVLTPKIKEFGRKLISVANSEFNFSFQGLDEQKDKALLPTSEQSFLTNPQRNFLTLMDLTWSCYSAAETSIFMLDQLFLPVLTLSEFAFFFLLGYAAVSFGKKVGLESSKTQIPANFNAVLETWIEAIQIQEQNLTTECEKASELIISNAKRWGNMENARIQFELKNI